eukprot:Skav204396  [mRNA]  locus=scaffold2947:178598:179590:+ [translate_table: standard]
MLEYGCFIDNTLSTSCDGTDTCEAHWWWFGLSLSILIISTVLQSFFYGDDCHSPGLCCLSCFQLGHLRDFCLVISGAKEDPEQNRRVLLRETTMKITESAPQLYLQSYVLFAVGAHRHRSKLMSVIISAMSLAFGVTKFIAHLKRIRCNQKFGIGLFIATDQLLRASAYALVLSEAARPIGVPLMLFFALVSWFIRYKADGGGWDSLLSPLLTGVAAGHIVPLLSLQAIMSPQAALKNQIKDLKLNGSDFWKKLYVYGALVPRYVEVAIYVVLGLTVAQRRCGFPPTEEVWVICGLLSANFCMLGLLRYVHPEEDTAVATVVVAPVGRIR